MESYSMAQFLASVLGFAGCLSHQIRLGIDVS